jgi:hypothetical protein
VVGPGRVEVERAVRASSVVVPRVLGQDSAQVPFTKINIRSVTSVRTVSTNRSAKVFARGLRGGIFTAVMPATL